MQSIYCVNIMNYDKIKFYFYYYFLITIKVINFREAVSNILYNEYEFCYRSLCGIILREGRHHK